MKPQALVTVIMPVYNVESYLKNSINSVVNQTYKNLQIILVNDGSTDGSSIICNEYAKIDKRITVIHQKNAGLSDARNKGLQKANGDYIFYLDSDDYLELDCIETLFKYSIRENADIVQTNFYYDYPDYLLYNNNLNGKDKVFTREEAMKALLKQVVIKNFAWGKLIRADIAKKHLFPKGKYFEDTLWMYKIINSINTYILAGMPMLYYLQRSSSISGMFSVRNLDQLELHIERLKHIKLEQSKEIYKKAFSDFNKMVLNHVQMCKSLQYHDRVYYEKVLKKYIDEFELRKNFRLLHIISSFPIFYKAMVRLETFKSNLYHRVSWVSIPKNNFQ